MTTAFFGVIVPFVAADGDTVISGQSFLSAGVQKLLTLPAQKCFQIHAGSTLSLFIGEVNILRHNILLYMVIVG